jgi:Cu/Ag efflux protein CusF
MTRRAVVATAAAAFLAACGPKKPVSFDYGAAKNHYVINGVIVRLKPDTRVAVIKHEKIEGWMEAMTMEFPVPSLEEFSKLKEGMAITASVEVNDEYYWLTGIKPQS